MKCENCGSSNKVKLNDKHFCTDCGNTVTPKHAKSTPKPQPAAPNTGHVLDLSSEPKPATTKHVKPAQSVHGIRKSTTPTQPASTHARQEPVKQPQKLSSRQRRAAQVSRSEQIKKFSVSGHTAPKPKEKPEPVPEPVTLNPMSTYMVNKKVAQADAQASIAMHHSRYSQPAAQDHAPSKQQPTSTLDKPSFFTRFKNLFHFSPRFGMAAAIAFSVVVLAGYITYLNYPSLSLRVAANRAGVDADLPNYTPSGYSFNGPINYTDGSVTLRFTSNADAGFFTLTQAKSNLDAASLEAYVQEKSSVPPVRTDQNGLIIYTYGSGSATWVNKGVLYTIEGNNLLGREQILKMAASL